MPAAILSIGDELVLGQTVDTNSAWLAQQLIRRGVTTLYHQTVADDRDAIADAIRHAVGRADVVLISGGLGPTEDDLTREALADAMGVQLVENADALRTLEQYFAKRDRPMPQRNRVQAMHPAGTAMIANPNGTAPGIHAVVSGSAVFVMPGVPREMKAMFSDSVLPHVEPSGNRRVILATRVNTFGLGESDAAQRLGDLMARDRNPRVGTTISGGICAVRVRSEFDTEAEAQQNLEQTVEAVTAAIGPTVFGRDEQTLPDALLAAAREAHMTIATAESCTGGLVSKYITDVSGSSDIYAGRWVTYHNEMKTLQLGVDAALIEQHGVVSEAVAVAMAEGALQRSGADAAVSLTGVAGPDGGSDDKPVGTVWIGLAWNDSSGVHSDAFHMLHRGDRAMVRDRSAKCALQLLRFHALGVSFDEIQWLRRPARNA